MDIPRSWPSTSQPQTGEADETPPNRIDRQKGLS
jgi:hypothetical protein